MSARADLDPPPRIDAESTDRPPHGCDGGPLVLIGGACTPHGHALRAFIELSGAKEGKGIVGLTTASAEPEENAQYWTGVFTAAGATNVAFPSFDRANPEVDVAIAAQIDAANAVFLGG